jgi:hypothetical protein
MQFENYHMICTLHKISNSTHSQAPHKWFHKSTNIVRNFFIISINFIFIYNLNIKFFYLISYSLYCCALFFLCKTLFYFIYRKRTELSHLFRMWLMCKTNALNFSEKAFFCLQLFCVHAQSSSSFHCKIHSHMNVCISTKN